MDIPIELFITFIASSIGLAFFGFIRNPQIPAMLFFAGLFIMPFAIMTDNIIFGSSIIQTDIHNHTTSIPTSTTRYQMGHSLGDSNDGNTLLTFNNPIFTTWTDPDPVFDNLDTYVEFNGSTQYGQASGNTQLDITTQDFSFMGLLYRDTDSGSNQRIVSKISATDGYTVYINSSDKLEIDMREASSTISLTSTSSINTGTWYAWGASFDRNDVMYLYLFNIATETLEVKVTSITTLSASITNTALFTMARNPGASSEFCDCWMDEVRFYNGIVLSGQEFHDIIHHGFTDSDVVEGHEHNTIEPDKFVFDQFPKTIFALLGAVFMLSGALMVFKGENDIE